MTQQDLNPAGDAAPSPETSADDIRDAARQAGSAAADAASEARDRLSDRGAETIDKAAGAAGDSLRAIADQLRQAGDSLEEPGWAKQAFSQGAQGLEQVSGYLREGRADRFLHDLKSLARDNPAAFIAGSVAVGFLAARIGKTAVEHATPSASRADAAEDTPPPTWAPGADSAGPASTGESI